MPLPSKLRPPAPRTRWNRSNRCGSSAAAMPVPVSRTVRTAVSPSRRRVIAMAPSSVNLKAFESRLRTTFSHISRSTATASSSGGQSTVKVRPALSIVDRKTLATSAVSVPRSTGSWWACRRPASMREKSSRVLTSFSRRWLFRCATSRCWRDSAGSPSIVSACSSGPSISASGVRNSWLTFEKNVVLARSSSASASARCRSSSAARALLIRPPIWAASSSNQRRYSASNGRRALMPSTIAPTLRPRPRSVSGSTFAAGGGSGHGPAGTAPIRSDRPVTSSAVPVATTRATGQIASRPAPSIGAAGSPPATPVDATRRTPPSGCCR